MNTTDTTGPASGRIMSIDALRGFDMFWIVGGTPLFLAIVKLFANPVPGWLLNQFQHKDWNGFSAEDLIMPLFLFIVGTAMPFSFAKRTAAGTGRAGVYLKILRRVVILWVLGMMYQGNLLKYDMSQLLLFSNTLQSIAVGYAFSAIVMLNMRVTRQVWVIVVLLVGYWALLNFVPVPGHGAVIREPTANLPLWVEEKLLGHFRRGAYVWIVPSLGFTATVLLGVMSGHLLRSPRSGGQKVLMLLGLAAGSLLLGWLWGQQMPINKHMWNSPMVLWAAGWSFLLLAVFYLLIDVLAWRAWAFPFVVVGANAIAAYVLVRIVDFKQFGAYFVGSLAPRIGVWGELLQTLISFGALWLLLWYFRRNKTFIRI